MNQPKYKIGQEVWKRILKFLGLIKPLIPEKSFACDKFYQHFSPLNRWNCRYCNACEYCGKRTHKFKDCPTKEELIKSL